MMARLATETPIVHESRELKVLCFENGIILLDDILNSLETEANLYSDENEWIENSILILLPLRLGISEISEDTWEGMRSPYLTQRFDDCTKFPAMCRCYHRIPKSQSIWNRIQRSEIPSLF